MLAAQFSAASEVKKQEEEDSFSIAMKHSRARLVEAVGFKLERGGVWEAPNDNHKPGEKSPQTWRLEHEWVFPETLMRYRIVGLYEDGRRFVFWEGTVLWDSVMDRAEVTQVSWFGAVGRGREEETPGGSVLIAVIKQPDGGAGGFRDEMTVLGPDSMSTRSFSYDATASEWKKSAENVWHRVALPAPASP